MRNELNEKNVGGGFTQSWVSSWQNKSGKWILPIKTAEFVGKSNGNYDGEVVIANDFLCVIYQKDQLKVIGGGGGDGLTPPVDETGMVNETKGLKILCGDYCGRSIILTQPYFSIPSMTFTNMLAMWFCGDISKNLPPYRMMRVKYVINVNGGKQKWSNIKYLVKKVIRAAGIANRHDLVAQNWFPRTVMDLYLFVRHFFAFPCLSSDKMRRCEKISWKTCQNGRAKYLGRSDGMSRAGGIGLVLQ